MISSYQDALLLVAGILCLVDIVVAVALVVGREAAALVLAQVLQRPRFYDHALQGNRFFLLKEGEEQHAALIISKSH